MSDLQQKKIAQLSAKSVTAEGEKWMRVIATAPTLDRDLEVIDTQSLRIPVKPKGWKYAKDLTTSDEIDLPFLYDHDWSVEKQLGSVRSMFINADGELETVVGVTSLPRGIEAHTLAKEGHLGNSFSGTFDYSTGYAVDGVFYDAEMIEFSMVFKGSNRDARLLEVSKAIKNKESNMAEATEQSIAEKQAEIERLQKEVAEAEENKPESKATDDSEEVKQEDEKPTETERETTEVNQEVTTEVEKPVETNDKPNEETQMTEEESKAIATKTATAKKAQVEQPVTAKKKMTDRERKILTVKQIRAMLQKNFAEVARLNKIAEEHDDADPATKAFKKKAISYEEGGDVSLYLCEQLERDIDAQYGDYGNVGTLVTRIRLTTSPNWRRIVRTDGVQFMKPGFVGVKGEDEPTWVSFTLAPKPFAVIVGWNDHVADDSYISMYDEIVRDITEAQARLEDELILLEDGETVADGTVYPVQGLVPILTAVGGREVNYTYDTQFVPAMAQAYGMINSSARQNLSLVLNGTTWGRVALLQDTQGRPLWQGNGQSVALGALGNVRIVTTDVLPAGTAVLGNFRNYTLAEKEGLELFESRHATVGGINAFTQDFTFLRAVKRLEGGTARTNAFVLLQDGSASS